MPSILDRIMEDQLQEPNEDNTTSKEPDTIAIPKDNELEKIFNDLKSVQQPTNTIQSKNNDITLEQSSNDIQAINPNTYEHILTEIQQHEVEMEEAIKNADELSKEVKESLIYYLRIRKPNRNGILMKGISDALSASAKLIDISVNGRFRLANMKKMRASILKDMSANTNSKDDFDLASILSE